MNVPITNTTDGRCAIIVFGNENVVNNPLNILVCIKDAYALLIIGAYITAKTVVNKLIINQIGCILDNSDVRIKILAYARM